MPHCRNHPDPDGRPQQPEHRLDPLKQETAPPEFLTRWPTDQQHHEECPRDGEPLSGVGQVRKGATFEDVHVEHHNPNRGRGDQGDYVPSDANPPPDCLTEELPQTREAGGPGDDRDRTQEGSERPQNDQYRRGRRRDMPELTVGSDERQPAQPGDRECIDRKKDGGRYWGKPGPHYKPRPLHRDVTGRFDPALLRAAPGPGVVARATAWRPWRPPRRLRSDAPT